MIIKPDEQKEFDTEERCHILELLNNPSIDKNLSIARARVKPDIETALHTLEGVEIYYILEGKGLVEIDGQSQEIGPGHLAYIDKKKTQKIKNIGSTDLLFLCICHPRFKLEDYTSLE